VTAVAAAGGGLVGLLFLMAAQAAVSRGRLGRAVGLMATQAAVFCVLALAMQPRQLGRAMAGRAVGDAGLFAARVGLMAAPAVVMAARVLGRLLRVTLRAGRLLAAGVAVVALGALAVAARHQAGLVPVTAAAGYRAQIRAMGKILMTAGAVAVPSMTPQGRHLAAVAASALRGRGGRQGELMRLVAGHTRRPAGMGLIGAPDVAVTAATGLGPLPRLGRMNLVTSDAGRALSRGVGFVA
jgi:hypothetical protein